MDNESGLPGGEMEFRDVTDLFLKAAAGEYLLHLQGLLLIIIWKIWNPTIFSLWKISPCTTRWVLWK